MGAHRMALAPSCIANGLNSSPEAIRLLSPHRNAAPSRSSHAAGTALLQ